MNEKVKKVLESVKSFFSNLLKNKKLLIIIGAVVAAIILVVLIILLSGTKSNERKLTNTLNDYAKNYYEEYYYKYTGKTEDEKVEYLSRFENTGLKINLENLLRYESTLEDYKEIKWVNNKTKEECNQETTMIIFYPQKPYGKKDYKVSIKLECGFNKEK